MHRGGAVGTQGRSVLQIIQARKSLPDLWNAAYHARLLRPQDPSRIELFTAPSRL